MEEKTTIGLWNVDESSETSIEQQDIYNGDNILRPERLDGESYNDYKIRRKVINQMVKDRLRYGFNVKQINK